MTNLFPAILLAGPPHCGKSVLSFLLTYRLREMRVSHYLLRAVPDGEGDWYLAGQPEVVQSLRTIHKTSFSSQFVEHMMATIEGRFLPLLVDIGGKPQGDQFGIIKACTHSILVYRTDEQLHEWREILSNSGLIPIAELHSTLTEEETIQKHQPFLQGIISGLERDINKRKAEMTFGLVLDRVAGICSYDETALEKEHEKRAPFPFQSERLLAEKLSVPVEGERTIWSPKHLARLSDLVPASQPLAVYGRGPVWLASALAACALPSSFAIFDARYGWLYPPSVHFSQTNTNLETRAVSYQGDNTWLEIGIPGGTLEPGELTLNPVPGPNGIAISGKLPRWLFATIVHALAPDHDWIAVDDPRLDQAIIVHSNISSRGPGDVLPRLMK
jgi:CRISPR-associated protein Csx3